MGFQTLDGIEVPPLTADQMRAVDDIAIENGVTAVLFQCYRNAGGIT